MSTMGGRALAATVSLPSREVVNPEAADEHPGWFANPRRHGDAHAEWHAGRYGDKRLGRSWRDLGDDLQRHRSAPGGQLGGLGGADGAHGRLDASAARRSAPEDEHGRDNEADGNGSHDRDRTAARRLTCGERSGHETVILASATPTTASVTQCRCSKRATYVPGAVGRSTQSYRSVVPATISVTEYARGSGRPSEATT